MAGVIRSRVGLWGFDLCVQMIVQEVGFPRCINSCGTSKLISSFFLGCRNRIKGIFRFSGGCVPNLLRTLLVRNYDPFPPAGGIPISNVDECAGASSLQVVCMQGLSVRTEDIISISPYGWMGRGPKDELDTEGREEALRGEN